MYVIIEEKMGCEENLLVKGLRLLPLLLLFTTLFAQSESSLGRAKSEIRVGHVREALSLLQSTTRDEPNNVEAHFLLGNLYLALRAYPQAQEQYMTVLNLDHKNVDVLFYLGAVYRQQGDVKKAVSYFQRVEHAKPNFLPAYENLGNLYDYIGDTPQAIEQYETLGRLFPSRSTTLALGRLYRKGGNYRKAEELLNSHLRKLPLDGEAWDILAGVQFDANDLVNAWNASERAVKLEPSNIRFLLTHARIAKGRKSSFYLSKAIDDSSAILRLDPNNAEAGQLFVEAKEALVLEHQNRIIVWISVSGILVLLCVIYLWRRGKKSDADKGKLVHALDSHLSRLNDLPEIAEYLVSYFAEYFNLPKGMFFLINRESTQLKCFYTNFKVVVSDSLDANPEVLARWVSVYHGRPMTAAQALKSALFIDSFPDSRLFFDKQDLRLILPFCVKGKLLAMLALGGVSRNEFLDLLPRIRRRVESAHILADTAATAIETAALYELSVIDEQTKVYNKRFFRQVLSEEIKRVERYHQPTSLIMLDIDHFKALNDSYGHPMGDSVLRELADLLKENVRNGVDSVSRYGGEEFTIILPATDLRRASETAERIRNSIGGRTFQGLPPNVRVTVSLGIAAYPHCASSDWELIQAADQALYQSKKEGRNRVSIAEQVVGPAPKQESILSGSERLKAGADPANPTRTEPSIEESPGRIDSPKLLESATPLPAIKESAPSVPPVVQKEDPKPEEKVTFPLTPQTTSVEPILSYKDFENAFRAQIQSSRSDGSLLVLACLEVENFQDLGSPESLLSEILSVAKPYLRASDSYSSPMNGMLAFMFTNKEKREITWTLENIYREISQGSWNGRGGQPILRGAVVGFPEDGGEPQDLLRSAQKVLDIARAQDLGVVATPKRSQH